MYYENVYQESKVNQIHMCQMFLFSQNSLYKTLPEWIHSKTIRAFLCGHKLTRKEMLIKHCTKCHIRQGYKAVFYSCINTTNHISSLNIVVVKQTSFRMTKNCLECNNVRLFQWQCHEKAMTDWPTLCMILPVLIKTLTSESIVLTTGTK